MNIKQRKARRRFAKSMGIKYSELKTLAMIDVTDGNEVRQLNLQALLSLMDAENA